MSTNNITLKVATGRDVADRWAAQYRIDGKWIDLDQRDPPEETYRRLVSLGPCPDVSVVDAIIGNNSWTTITCWSCGAHVRVAASLGPSEYESKQYCRNCIEQAAQAFGSV